jgi:hypothetical protein
MKTIEDSLKTLQLLADSIPSLKDSSQITDGIPNIQHSLECARSEAKQLPVLQEQVKQSTNRIKCLEQELSNHER